MIDEDGTTVLEAPPAEKKLKMSECTPLFMNAYKIANAGACVHSHSQNAVMATLLCGSEFRITNLEMIKGIRRGQTNANFGFVFLYCVETEEGMRPFGKREAGRRARRASVRETVPSEREEMHH